MGFYSNYDEKNLVDAYNNQIEHQGKASTEILDEIKQRESIESFKLKIDKQKAELNERNRIIQEIFKHFKNKLGKEECHKLLKSEIISDEEIYYLVHKKYNEIQNVERNLKLDSNTLFRGFIGIFIASTFSFLLLSIFFFNYGFIIYYFLIPLYIINYFIIKLVTRKTRTNLIVFIATFIATILDIAYFILFFKILK